MHDTLRGQEVWMQGLELEGLAGQGREGGSKL